jgi:adenylate kinase family enzyme
VPAGGTASITLGFYGHAGCNVEAIAECSVAGGPAYRMVLRGAADAEAFEVSPLRIAFSDVPIATRSRQSVTITNRGALPLQYQLAPGEDMELGQVDFVPNTGTVPADSEATIDVRLRADAPARFTETYLLQVGHGVPHVITVEANTIFPCVALDVPRLLVSPAEEAWLQEAIETVRELDPAAAAQAVEEGSLQRPLSALVGLELDRAAVRACVLHGYAASMTATSSATQARGATAAIAKAKVPGYLIDLGPVVRGKEAVRRVTLSNGTPTSVGFAATKAALGRLAERGLSLTPERLARLEAGDSVEIEVRLVARGIHRTTYPLGPVKTVCTLQLTDGPRVPLVLEANVCEPQLQASSASVGFGEVAVGRCRVVPVRLYNAGLVSTSWSAVRRQKKLPPHTSKKVLAADKRRRDMNRAFQVWPAMGTVAAGEYMDVELHFTPHEDGHCHSDLVLSIEDRPEPLTLHLQGRAVDPVLEFSTTAVELGPVLPRSAGARATVHVTNNSSQAVELFSPDYDAQHRQEETALRMLAEEFDDNGRLLLPPRAAGEAMPEELVRLGDEAPSNSDTRPASERLRPSRAWQDGRPSLLMTASQRASWEGTSAYPSARPSITDAMTAVPPPGEALRFVLERYLGGKGFERRQRRDLGGINVIVYGPRGSGKSTAVKAWAERFHMLPLQVDDVLMGAMRDNSSAGKAIRAYLLEHQAVLLKAEQEQDQRSQKKRGNSAITTLHQSAAGEGDAAGAGPQPTDPETQEHGMAPPGADEAAGDGADELPPPALLPLKLLTDAFAERIAQEDTIGGVIVDGVTSAYGAPTVVATALLKVLGRREHVYVVAMCAPLDLCVERLQRAKEEAQAAEADAERERRALRPPPMLDEDEYDALTLEEQHNYDLQLLAYRRKVRELEEQAERERQRQAEAEERKNKRGHRSRSSKRGKGSRQGGSQISGAAANGATTGEKAAGGGTSGDKGGAAVEGDKAAGGNGSDKGAAGLAVQAAEDEESVRSRSVSPLGDMVERSAQDEGQLRLLVAAWDRSIGAPDKAYIDAYGEPGAPPPIAIAPNPQVARVRGPAGLAAGAGLSADEDGSPRLLASSRLNAARPTASRVATPAMRDSTATITSVADLEAASVPSTVPGVSVVGVQDSAKVPLLLVDASRAQDEVVAALNDNPLLPSIAELEVNLGLVTADTSAMPPSRDFTVVTLPAPRTAMADPSSHFQFVNLWERQDGGEANDRDDDEDGINGEDDEDGAEAHGVGSATGKKKKNRARLDSRSASASASKRPTSSARRDKRKPAGRAGKGKRDASATPASGGESGAPTTSGGQEATPGLFHMPANEAIFTPANARWVVPPQASIAIGVQFFGNSVGRFDEMLGFEAVGTGRRYAVYARGICAFPALDDHPRTVFGPNAVVKPGQEPNPLARGVYVVDTNTFAFGPVLSGKSRDDFKSMRHPDSARTLTLRNPGHEPIIVAAALAKDASFTTFAIHPARQEVPANGTAELEVFAYPKASMMYTDELVISVVGTPKPLVYNISVEGVEPCLEVAHKNLSFERVMLRRTDTKMLNLINPTKLPVAWALSGTDQLGEEIRAGATSGVVDPLGSAQVPFYFQSSKPTSLKRSLRLEVSDVDNVAGIVQAEHIQISAESYDVALDVSFPKAGEALLDYEAMRVGEERSLTCNIKNKGKYELGFRFALDRRQKRLYARGLPESALVVHPATGTLSATDKSSTVRFTLKVDKELQLLPAPLLLLEVYEPNVGEVIAQIPIQVAASVTYSRYSLLPARGINFGAVTTGSGKQTREVCLENTGEHEFRFVISKQSQSEVPLSGNSSMPRNSQGPAHGGKSVEPSGGVNSFRFTAGCFTISPATGSVQPGQTIRVTVEADASLSGREAQTLMFDIERRAPDDHPDGLLYSLAMEACLPAITRDPVVVFDELGVCQRFDSNAGMRAPLTFAVEENLLSLGAVVLGHKVQARIKVANPTKVPSEVLLTVRPAEGGFSGGLALGGGGLSSSMGGGVGGMGASSSAATAGHGGVGASEQGSGTRGRRGGGGGAGGGGNSVGAANISTDGIFSIEPAKLLVPSHEQRYVTVTFAPSAIQAHQAIFEAVVEEGDPDADSMRFVMHGDGVLPRVAVVEPAARNTDNIPMLQFRRTLVDHKRTMPIRVRNDGPIPAEVVLEVGAHPLRTISRQRPRAPAAVAGTRPVSRGGSALGSARDSRDKRKPSPKTKIKRNLDPAKEVLRDSDGPFSSTQGLTPITLAPDEEHTFELLFSPSAPESFETVLKLHVTDNEFESLFIAVEAEGYEDDIVLEGLDEEEEGCLAFGDTPLGHAIERRFELLNCSGETVRYSWIEADHLACSPETGHIPAGQSATIVVAFSSEEPVQLESTELRCTLCKVEGPDTGGAWHSGQTQVRFHVVEEVGGRLVKKREELPVPEPAFSAVPESDWELVLACNGTADHARAELTLPSTSGGLHFGNTLAFDRLTKQIILRNTGRVALRYDFVLEDDRMGGAARPLPFNVRPASGKLAAGAHLPVTVGFAPLEADKYDASMMCNVAHLAPELVLAPLELTGSSELPTHHFELVDSDYVSSGRRRQDLPGPEGLPGQLSTGLRVLEFGACGVRVLTTQNFRLINPRRGDFDFEWRPLSPDAVQTPAGWESGPFRCRSSRGTCPGKAQLQMSFEFVPLTLDLVEAFWEFRIPSLDITTRFLLVGHAEEPRVSLDMQNLDLPPLQVGRTVHRIVNLINEEDTEQHFRFDAHQLEAINRAARVTVAPSVGTILPNGQLPVRVGFSPRLEQPYDFKLVCNVRRKPTPVTLKVRSEGYLVHGALEVQPFGPSSRRGSFAQASDDQDPSQQPAAPAPTTNAGGAAPPTPAIGGADALAAAGGIIRQAPAEPVPPGQRSVLDFGHVHVNEACTRTLYVVNHGKFPLKYDFSAFRERPSEASASMGGAAGAGAGTKGRAAKVAGAGTLRGMAAGSDVRRGKATQVPMSRRNTTVGLSANAPITVSPMSGTVGNGGRIAVEVTYSPTTGEPLQGLGLECRLEEGPTYTLMLAGAGARPEVELSESRVAFGKVFVHRPGMPLQRRVVILHNQDRKGVSVRCLHPSGQSDLRVSCPARVLEPDERVEAVFIFMPSSAGSFKVAVEFELNSLTRVAVNVTAAAVPLRLQLERPAQQRTVDFGALQVGAQASRAVTLVNRSTLPVTFSLTADPAGLAAHCLSLEPVGEMTLPPNGRSTLKAHFAPRARIPAFAEEVGLAYLGQLDPLLTLSGSCQGVVIELDHNQLSFGAVVVGSSSTRRVLMANEGDIGTRYKWDTSRLGPSFSVSPKEGYISPGLEVTFSVTFHPTTERGDVRCEGVQCTVEGVDHPIFLDLSGVAVAVQPEREMLSFSTEVRQPETKALKITNSTPQPWTLTPVVAHEFFSGPPTLVVPAGETKPYPVTYLPLRMTQGRGTRLDDGRWSGHHNGAVFFALPQGGALLYNTQGQAQPPKPLDHVVREVPCKVWYTLALPVKNWLARAQRFRVKVQRSKMDPTVLMEGPEYLEVPGNQEREYNLRCYAYKEGVTAAEVVFTNEASGEYVTYDLALRATPAGSLETLQLRTVVRQPVSQTVRLHNPLTMPVTFTMACTLEGSNKACTEVHGPSTFRVPPKTEEAEYTVEYLPLLSLKREVRLTLTCSELGSFVYDLALEGLPAGPQPTERFTACLGEQTVHRYRFTNFCTARCEYTITLEGEGADQFSAPASQQMPAALKTGTEVSLEVVYEPTTLGDVRAMMIVSSPVGGEYYCPLFGQCLPPKPSGPHVIRASGTGRVQLPFKNVFQTAETFHYTVDNPHFQVKATESYKAREAKEIVVRFDGGGAASVGGKTLGKLTVTCGKPSAPLAATAGGSSSGGGGSGNTGSGMAGGSGPIEWIFYVAGQS